LAAATGGFSMDDADVADPPAAAAAVEVPLTYEQQLDQLREAGNAKYKAGGCLVAQKLRHSCGFVWCAGIGVL
jgi:hypothetical protein